MTAWPPDGDWMGEMTMTVDVFQPEVVAVDVHDTGTLAVKLKRRGTSSAQAVNVYLRGELTTQWFVADLVSKIEARMPGFRDNVIALLLDQAIDKAEADTAGE